MHELSLSYATVDTVLESIVHLRVQRVKSITILAGELSGVSMDAFRFSFPIAAAGTVLEGAELHLETLPVSVFCPVCNNVGILPDIRRFRCPTCGLPTADLRGGKEFLVQAIEIENAEVPQDEHAYC